MKNSGRHLSMDAPLKEGETSSLYDVVNIWRIAKSRSMI